MPPQTKDEIADDNEFVGFDESEEEIENNDDMSVDEDEEEEEEDSDMDSIADPRKKYEIDEKDSDEEDLERFVLGNNDTFRAQLFRDDFLADLTDSKALIKADGQDGTTGLEDVDDNALFAFDTGIPGGDKKQTEAAPSALEAYEQREEPPAWEDSDDERLTVSLAAATRLRKLRQSEAEDVVSGTEYARRLRSQYLRLYPLPEWAKESSAASQRRRRRSSAAGSSSEDDSEAEDDIDSALPLETYLRDVNSFNASNDGRGSKRRKLRPETIDIQRSRDIPDTHKQSVSSLSFHPKHPILLSCSVSSIMYLHQIDPTAHPVPNPALTSVQVKRTDLRRSEFLGPDGDDIIFAGRRRYFHSWNLASGAVKKVTQIQGHQREQRTMENFRPSPCGRYLGLIASEKKGGGMVNIVNVRTMQWIAQARTNGRGGISDFAWWGNGNGLSILGKNGQVTEWSMLSRRTVGVWRDEGSIGGTVIALGGQKGTGPSQIGGDRWVAVGSNSGILNIYDRNDLVEPVKKQQSGGASNEETVQIKSIPTPQRTLEHLTTPISVVTFASDGQLLAFGSIHKKDALRLVHLPSCTVYRNWPTEQTPLGRITAVAFSHQNGGDVLAVGNDVGKIRMWEIRS